MAYLSNEADDPAAAMGFTMRVLGLESASGMGEWVLVELSIDAFGTRVSRPGKASISRRDLFRLIEWLRRAVRSDSQVPPFKPEDEPLLQLRVEPSDGPVLKVSVFLTSFGCSETYHDESTGVSVTFEVGEEQLTLLADGLEHEVGTVHSMGN